LTGRTARKIAKNITSTLRDRHLYKVDKRKGHPDATKKPRSITTRRLVRTQLSSGFTVLKNPRLALREAFAAIRYSIKGDIAAVQATGIPVHVVVAHSDELFGVSSGGDGPEQMIELPGIHHSLADKHAP